MTTRAFDDGKASVVWVHTNFEKIGLPRETSAIGYDQGWPYAERRLREDGRCAAGFQPFTAKTGDREIPVILTFCSDVSFVFQCNQ